MLIAFTGLAGHGKSTSARYLKDFHNYKLIKFADPLKNMLRAYYITLGLDSIEIERRIEGDLKELSDENMAGRSPRFAMQTLGTEWGRQIMNDNFWTEAFLSSVNLANTDLITNDDTRFTNEAAVIRHLQGKIVRIYDPRKGGPVYNHASETNEVIPDITIINDGTIDDLYKKLDELI